MARSHNVASVTRFKAEFLADPPLRALVNNFLTGPRSDAPFHTTAERIVMRGQHDEGTLKPEIKRAKQQLGILMAKHALTLMPHPGMRFDADNLCLLFNTSSEGIIRLTTAALEEIPNSVPSSDMPPGYHLSLKLAKVGLKPPTQLNEARDKLKAALEGAPEKMTLTGPTLVYEHITEYALRGNFYLPDGNK